MESLKKLQLKPKNYWLDLLKKYFIDAPSATVRGIPSSMKQQELAEEESKRIKEQMKKLGPEGLKEKEDELMKSIEENEVFVFKIV